MHPFTRVVPKELTPLGSRPGIHWVVEEAVGAGLDEICIVLSPDKQLLRDYLTWLCTEPAFSHLRIEYVYQRDPQGLAEAVALCRDFAADEPFALLLPDNICLARRSSLATMISVFEHTETDVVAYLELDHTWSNRFGNCGRFEEAPYSEQAVRIRCMYDKQPGRLEIPQGEILRRTCGRYVCHPALFADIDTVRPTISGEYDEVPLYQRVIGERGLLGVNQPLPLFDIGNPSGMLAACAELLKRRADH